VSGIGELAGIDRHRTGGAGDLPNRARAPARSITVPAPRSPTLRSVAKAHFRLFGIPIRIEPFFVIVAFLFGLNIHPLWVVFAWVVIVIVSVLVHELGHALTYRALGQRSAIVLHGFGGFTVPAGGGRRVLSKPKAVFVSLSGALAQLLFLGLPAWVLYQSSAYADEVLTWAFVDGTSSFSWAPIVYYLQLVSIWWAVFNLLPIRPLDGGHVAETLLGFEMACKLSIGAAIVAAFVTFRSGQFGFIGLIFFGMFAFMNYRDLKNGQSTGVFDVDAPEGSAARRGGGRGRSRPGRRGRPDLQVVHPAGSGVPDLTPRLPMAEAETRAWNALRAGDGGQAAAILRSAGDGANPFLRASIALASGPPELADDLFESAYRAEPGGPPNLVPATMLADSGRAPTVAGRLVAAGPVGVEAASGLQTHLHYAERFGPAAEVGEQVFAAGPQSPAQTAFEVACSWARAGSADEALRWVEAAVDAGFRAPGLLDGEPDLASVRALPGWPAVRARLSA
jgi:Zn-dependent protease